MLPLRLESLVSPSSHSFIKQPTRRKINSITIIGIVSGAVPGIVIISFVVFFIFRRGKGAEDRDYSNENTWWGLSTFHAINSTKTRGQHYLPISVVIFHWLRLEQPPTASIMFSLLVLVGLVTCTKGTLMGGPSLILLPAND